MDRRQLAAGVSEAKRRADLAETAGEIPVGACILSPSGEIIASASNLCEEENDQTRHAEIICISEACRKMPGKRLLGCSLVVTLEPCLMCLGAALNAGLERVYYLVASPDSGAFSRYEVNADIEEHHLADETEVERLKDFFRRLR